MFGPFVPFNGQIVGCAERSVKTFRKGVCADAGYDPGGTDYRLTRGKSRREEAADLTLRDAGAPGTRVGGFEAIGEDSSGDRREGAGDAGDVALVVADFDVDGGADEIA